MGESITVLPSDNKEAGIDISLIIVVHNSHDSAAKCIESFRKASTCPSEIILVDNGEATVTHAQVDRILKIENKGYSNGVNQGTAAATGRYLLICNPDVVFHDDAVSELISFMEKSPDAGAVGPRVFSENAKVQPTARTFPTPSAFFFNRTSLLTRIFPGNKQSAKYLDRFSTAQEPVEPDWISGCCMFVRREAFDDVGGFDEGYFLFMEDVDFCWRLWKTGSWRVCYLPSARIEHSVGISDRKRDKQIIRHRHRSIRRFIDLYYENKSGFSRIIGKLLITLREKIQLIRAQ